VRHSDSLLMRSPAILLTSEGRLPLLPILESLLPRKFKLLGKLAIEADLLALLIKDVDGNNDDDAQASQDDGWVHEVPFLRADVLVN